jgi:hypothetical protein
LARALFLGIAGEEEEELLRLACGIDEQREEETKFLTLVCQIMGEDRFMRSSGPLSRDSRGTAPNVPPVRPFRCCACWSVFVYLNPRLSLRTHTHVHKVFVFSRVR